MRKDGEVRKRELMDTALKLFYKNGYEGTSVQTIIDEVGISKGGFYHHFKSKQELFDVLFLPYTAILKNIIQQIVDDKKLNALEKLNKMIVTGKRFKASQKEISLEFLKLWLKGAISLTDPLILKKTMEMISPLWQKVIEQGKDEGIFDTSDPMEATESIILLGNEFNKKLGDLFIHMVKNPAETQEILKLMEKKVLFFEDTIERLLGVMGQIHFAEPYMNNVYLMLEEIVEPLRKFLEENNLF